MTRLPRLERVEGLSLRGLGAAAAVCLSLFATACESPQEVRSAARSPSTALVSPLRPKPPPAAPSTYRQEGEASWYGAAHHGKKTASGGVFDRHALTAAHRTLPFGTRVRVTNLENGRSVVLVIDDRGPYVDGRLIDVSEAAARRLGFRADGIAKVRVEELPGERD